MRYLALAAVVLLAACDATLVQAPRPAPTPAAAPAPVVTRSASSAQASFQRSVRRIEPVAEQTCRSRNPEFPPIACDFRFSISTDPKLGQNAFQTIDRKGQPQVVFTLSLLQILENDDEVAFILAHEAGHQIAKHLIRQNNQQRLGATLLAGLLAATGQASQESVNQAANIGAFLGGRVYSKNFELEADRIATVITAQAGYDPVKGAAPFARFETGSSGVLSTHPPSAQRLEAVEATAARIGAR